MLKSWTVGASSLFFFEEEQALKLQSLDTRKRAQALITPPRCVWNEAINASVNSNNRGNAWNFNANDNGNVEVNNNDRDNDNNVRCVGR